MPAAASDEPMIAMPDAGIAPEELLDRDRQRQAGLVCQRVHHEVPAVQTDLAACCTTRLRELLALVPFVGRGAHDVVGEVVDPLLDLDLVFVEMQGELGHIAQVTHR